MNTDSRVVCSARVRQPAVRENTGRPSSASFPPRGGQLSKRDIVRRDIAKAMSDYLVEAETIMWLAPIGRKTSTDDLDLIAMEAERRFRNRARLILVVNGHAEDGLDRSCTKFRAAALRKVSGILDDRLAFDREAEVRTKEERTILLEFSLDIDP